MPRAVRYHEFGGTDVLRVDEVERPVPGEGQVLVRVKAFIDTHGGGYVELALALGVAAERIDTIVDYAAA